MARYANKHMIHTDLYKPAAGTCVDCVFSPRGCQAHGVPPLPPSEQRRIRRDSDEPYVERAEKIDADLRDRQRRVMAAFDRLKEAHA